MIGNGTPDSGLLSELGAEIGQEMDVMTAVATGGPRIQDVDRDYRERRRRIRRLLQRVGLEDPNPHADLWAWYGKWTRDLGGYQARRDYVRELYGPLLVAIEGLERDSIGSQLPGSDDTGWPAVDAQIAQLRVRLSTCTTSEDAQAVGLLCRDIMISLAAATHDASIHGEVGSSAVDRLNAVVDHCAGGPANQILRRLLKTSIDYANVIQHRRECSVTEAGLAAEATVSAANLVRRLGAGVAR